MVVDNVVGGVDDTRERVVETLISQECSPFFSCITVEGLCLTDDVNILSVGSSL